MSKATVFIDKSGTLPDPSDKLIVFAAVATKNPQQIDKLIQKARKRGHFKRKSGELKFYTAGSKTKTVFFESLVRDDFNIFILVVEKMRRKIPDTPKHFALLCSLLISNILVLDLNPNVIFDRHFSIKNDEIDFNNTLNKLLNKELSITHVDSMKNKRVNIADMVAGAVLAAETGKDDRFYKLIEERIVSFNKLNWVEAKKRLFK